MELEFVEERIDVFLDILVVLDDLLLNYLLVFVNCGLNSLKRKRISFVELVIFLSLNSMGGSYLGMMVIFSFRFFFLFRGDKDLLLFMDVLWCLMDNVLSFVNFVEEVILFCIILSSGMLIEDFNIFEVCCFLYGLILVGNFGEIDILCVMGDFCFNNEE